MASKSSGVGKNIKPRESKKAPDCSAPTSSATRSWSGSARTSILRLDRSPREAGACVFMGPVSGRRAGAADLRPASAAFAPGRSSSASAASARLPTITPANARGRARRPACGCIRGGTRDSRPLRAETTPQRLRMGEFPEGSSIIPNPVNRIPGFSTANITSCRAFHRWRSRWSSGCSTRATGSFSTATAGARSPSWCTRRARASSSRPWKRSGAAYGGVKVFSLPSMGHDGSRRHVELGVRGDPAQVRQAAEALRSAVREAGFPFTAE